MAPHRSWQTLPQIVLTRHHSINALNATRSRSSPGPSVIRLTHHIALKPSRSYSQAGDTVGTLIPS